jgi:hypothetical protein
MIDKDIIKKDESLPFKEGDKIMGLGEVPGYSGYTLAGGEIIGIKEKSYIVKSAVVFDEDALIKMELAMIFNEGAWNRAVKHWLTFWKYGYSDEEAEQIPEDKRRYMDIKSPMEFLRAIISIYGFNVEDVADDELIQNMDAGTYGPIRTPKLVVTIKNGIVSWRVFIQ